MKAERIFLIILDSLGIGNAPDAELFGDKGSNTLSAIAKSNKFYVPNLKKLGLFNIDSVDCHEKEKKPSGSYARLIEKSKGKDTTIGHWEISGVISNKALPTYPNGFPVEILNEFSKQTGRKVLCNMPYSGTDVINDFGKEHIDTGDLIVYTSADSVFQIAAHEEVVPLKQLYQYCEIARNILIDEHAVARVIARPFIGTAPNFTRTSNRHDFSVLPPKKTMLDYLMASGFETIGIGKTNDIFAGQGISKDLKINKNNDDGMEKSINTLVNDNFKGLCFVNLVDFDMLFGHRNDVDGYANAMTEFDVYLGEFIKQMKDTDVLFITADHGCDPSTPSTDHSRECVPFLAYGNLIKENNSLGARNSFADIANTIMENFNVSGDLDGVSFLNDILK